MFENKNIIVANIKKINLEHEHIIYTRSYENLQDKKNIFSLEVDYNKKEKFLSGVFKDNKYIFTYESSKNKIKNLDITDLDENKITDFKTKKFLTTTQLDKLRSMNLIFSYIDSNKILQDVLDVIIDNCNLNNIKIKRKNYYFTSFINKETYFDVFINTDMDYIEASQHSLDYIIKFSFTLK